jgi:hypothetical protein
LKDEHADISSAAAETHAAATAVNDILMMQYVCEEMGVGFQLPFILQVDNQAACCFASQEQYSGKSKLDSIDQRQAWVTALRVAASSKRSLSRRLTIVQIGSRWPTLAPTQQPV